MALLVLSPEFGLAQTVSARLALFADPAPRPASPGELVLGTTTLAEARLLFPDAPPHPGPLPIAGKHPNPWHAPTAREMEIGGKRIRQAHHFLLGRGRATLAFDDHQRLISISQSGYAYYDQIAQENVQIDNVPWDRNAVSRNEFHAHYPASRGTWVDRWHYTLEGLVRDCIAVTASFSQDKGVDQLNVLEYHYTCSTEPVIPR